MSQIKNGRRSVETKRQPSFISNDEVFGSLLHVDEDVKKEVAAKGLELRWLDANMMIRNGNYHPAGWTVYRREKKGDSDILGFKFGNDPEGIIRRGTCVLGVRPIAHGDKHRALNAQRAARQSGKPMSAAAEQLREMAKSGNVRSVVDDSFDE